MRKYLFTAKIVAMVDRSRPNANTAPSTINIVCISNSWTNPSSSVCK